MRPRLLFICLVILGLPSGLPAADLPNATQGQPNVVIIYTDDLGYGDLGSYGHHTIRTPHLDRLASEGVRLTDYYAPAPLCSPSRAGLLTGRTPFRTGIRSWIPEDTAVQREVTLATLLKQEGYETFLGGEPMGEVSTRSPATFVTIPSSPTGCRPTVKGSTDADRSAPPRAAVAQRFRKPGAMPSPSSKTEPTAPTTAVSRLN